MYQRHLIEVDPQRIKLNPLNPRKHRGTEYIRLKASIQAIGIIQPPIVRVLSGTFYEAIDGEGRVSIAQEEHFEKIWVVSVGIIDEHEALVMLQASNALRSFNFLAECRGLATLHRQGMTTSELAKQFSVSNTKIQDMVTIGYYPAEILRRIEENIATSEKQAEVWNYSLLANISPLREVLPGKNVAGQRSPSNDLYDYHEVQKAVEKVIRGEIMTGGQMHTYVAGRKYEIYQERFDQDLHRKLEEELTQAKQELNKAKEQQIHDIEEKTQRHYSGQIDALQRQLDDLANRHAAVIKEVAKRPEIVEQREKELLEEVQKTETERQQLQDSRRELEEQVERTRMKLEEEVRRKQKQLEDEAKQILNEELAEQQKRQKQELKKTENDIKAFYEQKDQERQIKAENTIHGLLSHGIKSLAEAQQVIEHIISASMIQGVQQLGGAQQENFLWAIRSMSETLDRAESKLAYSDSVLPAESGVVNGYKT